MNVDDKLFGSDASSCKIYFDENLLLAVSEFVHEAIRRMRLHTHICVISLFLSIFVFPIYT